MTGRLTVIRGAALLLAGLVLAGCGTSSQTQVEEEKEAHFLAGKSLVSEMDYKGAIEAFEKALEANPRSASAHFELAWLFDQKEADPAAAIFHYDRYLRYRPGAENEETVRTRILACKQELARNISLGPVTQSLQREFEQLTQQNRQLREEVSRWRAFAAARAQAQTNLPAATPAVLRLVNPSGAATPRTVAGPGRSSQAPAVATRTPAGPAPVSAGDTRTAVSTGTSRSHAVKSGETLTGIARKYGVRLNALMAANPRVDERRLRVGQELSIPPV